MLGINSAIAAFYCLRLAFVPLLENTDASIEPAHESPFRSRRVAAILSAVGVVALTLVGNTLMKEAAHAAAYLPSLTGGEPTQHTSGH